MQAIGYRQVAEHLRGERTLPDTIELVKARTRKYAKRQLTWFRVQASADWVQLAAAQEGEDAAEIILRRLGGV